MNPKRISAYAGAAACALSLGVTSFASANASQRTMANTFPVANKLCMEVKAGGGNARVKANAAAITTDCTTLETTFNELTKTAITGQTTVRAALVANGVTLKTACPKPTTVRAVCRTTRRTVQVSNRKLFIQRFEIAFTYQKGLEAARLAFWTAIKALPGDKGLKADSTIPLPTPPKGLKIHQ